MSLQVDDDAAKSLEKAAVRLTLGKGASVHRRDSSLSQEPGSAPAAGYGIARRGSLAALGDARVKFSDENGCLVPPARTLSSVTTTGSALRSEDVLVGSIVRRVVLAFMAEREVALIRLRVPPRLGAAHGENVAILVAASHGVGCLDGQAAESLRAAMRQAPSPHQPRWRACLEGGRVIAVSAKKMEFDHVGQRVIVESGSRFDLGIEDVTGRDDARQALASETSFGELNVRGLQIVADLGAQGAGSARSQLAKELRRALLRIDKRIAAISGDIQRMAAAQRLAEQARLFVAEGSRAPGGATELTATDWSTGEPLAVHMQLDPARRAEEQIEAVFKRARRLREGAKIAQSRLDAAEGARETLRAISVRLEAVDGTADLDIEALARDASLSAPHDFRRTRPIPVSSAKRTAYQAPLPPFRAFASGHGVRILVGRSAGHNDALSFHVARPHDLWLHARGRAGAHVVVSLDRGAGCPSDVLIDAAHLAAHFSDARDEDLVEVEYTSRRYVRKPRGSEPGLVVVTREKVLVLRRSEIVLRRLLDRELER